jgi:polyhydroxyalkanoate synthesis regulator phasin
MALQLKQLVEEQVQELQALKSQGEAVAKQWDSKQTEELRTELVRRNCEVEVLKEEIKRLKVKVNNIASAYEEHLQQQQ